MDDGHPETARSGANMNTVSANTQVWELMFAKVPFEEACAAKFCNITAGVFEPIDVTALRLGIRRSMLRPELNAKGNCGNWLV
jgi:hypothetical protein